MVHYNVRLHWDQLLLVKLSEVQQGELIKLLVAEQHLFTDSFLKSIEEKYHRNTFFPNREENIIVSIVHMVLSPPCPSSSWPRSTVSALPGGGWGHTGSRCSLCLPSSWRRTPPDWSAVPQAEQTTRTSAALQCPPVHLTDSSDLVFLKSYGYQIFD